MSEDTAPVVVTLKAGTGYDAPWIVIRGYDPDDVVNKLNALDGIIDATLEAAGKFVAGRAFPQSAPAQSEPPSPAPPTSQPAQQAWGGQSSPAGGGAPTSKFGAQLHPEGKTCEHCPNVLELKKSSGGKAKWQCADWRWNGGNPNNHTVEWID